MALQIVHILCCADSFSRSAPEGTLSARPRGLGAGSAGGTDRNAQGGDANLPAAGGDVLGGQHGGGGGGLVTVAFDFHAAGDAGDGFLAGQIGDVHEGVVEVREDVSNICGEQTKERSKEA